MIRFIVRQFLRTLLVLTLAITPNCASLAQDRYVSANGNNDGSGSKSKPWASIQHAIAQAGPGQTVYVRGGAYREKVRFDSDHARWRTLLERPPYNKSP